MLVLGSPAFYVRALPQALRDHLELVFVELRHFVPVEDGFDVSTIDFDLYADDIDALRQAAGIERAVVLGTSIHGAIAREYAARYPETVRGIVDLGSSPPPRPRRRRKTSSGKPTRAPTDAPSTS